MFTQSVLRMGNTHQAGSKLMLQSKALALRSVCVSVCTRVVLEDKFSESVPILFVGSRDLTPVVRFAQPIFSTKGATYPALVLL